MDIICIGQITIYLARNVFHIIQIFVLVVDIIWIGYIIHSFVLFMDIICIGHITSYLAHNIHPIFHIYSSIVNDCCINYFPVCNLIYIFVPSYFWILFWWVSINWILTLSGYMCLLLSLQQKLVFLFHLFFDLRVVLLCCIDVLYSFCAVCVLYKCVVSVLYF